MAFINGHEIDSVKKRIKKDISCLY